MSTTKETTTLTHEQCAELVEKIVEQSKRESSALLPGHRAAFALGVLMVKATDWLTQLEKLRGEILKLK